MKAVWIFALLAGLASAAITGCGSSGSNSNSNPTCPLSGCFGAFGGPTGNYGPLSQFSQFQNSVIFYSQGPINITNGIAYRTFLHGNGGCALSMFNSCAGSDAAPTIGVALVDYTFGSGNNWSAGGVMIGGQIYSNVGFRLSNGNSGFSAAVQSGISYGGFLNAVQGNGGMMQINISGRPTDSTIQANLIYNGQQVGFGTLVRVK